MLYIFLALLSGIFGGLLSLYFRFIELKKEIILMPKQLFTQFTLFIIFALMFREFFSETYINLGVIQLGWFMIYIIFSSAGFYAIQVFYEFFSGNELFATEAEMKKYLEKIEKDRF